MTLPRVYPILDTPSLTRRGCDDWAMVARAFLEGGAGIVQFRHKGDWTPAVYEQTEFIAEDCRRHGVTLVVNDRVDIAMLLHAGVHVGQDDLTPKDCRKVIGETPILGFSTHNADQLAAAATEPVDYLAFGPIFATTSKENPDPVAGLALLTTTRTRIAKPLVAIGGITRETVHSVLAAGADSIALIGDLLPDELNHSTIRGRMEEWQRLTRQ
jgi:thiamine-phosphate pyrophosphorylase